MSSVPHPRKRVAVLGGGIAGLAAAHRVLELSGGNVDLVLFEAGPRLGGVVGTELFDGYLVETGADMFITSNPAALSLCGRLGLEGRLIPTDATYRGALVLRKGRPVPVPEGFQLLSPAKVWPVLRSPIFSPWGKLRMGLEYLLPSRATETDESLASFVRRRFGGEALDRLIQPLVGGIYTSDPEKLSLRATLPRFLEMERSHGSIIRALRQRSSEAKTESATGARYGLFVTLAGGMSELVSALTDRIQRAATVRLQSEVRQVSIVESAADVHPANGPIERFDAVVVALPAHRAADVISAALPAAASELRQIEYASTVIVVSGHRLADIRHPLDSFGLVVPAIEGRRILAVSFPSRKFHGRAPPGRVQLRTFVGGAMQPELVQLPDDEIRRIVRSELESIFGVSGREDFVRVIRWTRAMPQYHVGHLERVAAIERSLAGHPRVQLAGNAYRGVGIPDCIHSGEQAAEETWRRLNS